MRTPTLPTVSCRSARGSDIMNSRHVLAFLGVGTLLAVGLFGRGSQGPHTSKRFGDPLTWSHDALVDHAYGMFRQLTSGDNPTWERQDMGWRDECDIGLAESTCDAEPVSTPETKGVSQSTKSSTGDRLSFQPQSDGSPAIATSGKGSGLDDLESNIEFHSRAAPKSPADDLLQRLCRFHDHQQRNEQGRSFGGTAYRVGGPE